MPSMAGSPTCHTWEGMGQSYFPTLATLWHMREGVGAVLLLSCPQALLTGTPANRVSSNVLPRCRPCSLAPLRTGSGLVCCSGEVQDPLSHMLQLVREEEFSPSGDRRASSPTKNHFTEVIELSVITTFTKPFTSVPKCKYS